MTGRLPVIFFPSLAGFALCDLSGWSGVGWGGVGWGYSLAGSWRQIQLKVSRRAAWVRACVCVCGTYVGGMALRVTSLKSSAEPLWTRCHYEYEIQPTPNPVPNFVARELWCLIGEKRMRKKNRERVMEKKRARIMPLQGGGCLLYQLMVSLSCSTDSILDIAQPALCAP